MRNGLRACAGIHLSEEDWADIFAEDQGSEGVFDLNQVLALSLSLYIYMAGQPLLLSLSMRVHTYTHIHTPGRGSWHSLHDLKNIYMINILYII
jgi:hypothetical protein